MSEGDTHFAEFRARLDAAERLNEILSAWGRRHEARRGVLAARLWRLIAWAKRQPKPAGRPRKPEVGKRRRRQLAAAARTEAAAAAARAEAERTVPVRLVRRFRGDVGRARSGSESIRAAITYFLATGFASLQYMDGCPLARGIQP